MESSALELPKPVAEGARCGGNTRVTEWALHRDVLDGVSWR